MSSEVNVLINSIKIFHITKRDFFPLNCFHSEQKMWLRCCRKDFSSVCSPLPSCFSKGLPKQDFLDNYLTTLFRFCNFQNRPAMSFIFVFKMFLTKYRFQRCTKKLGKRFFFLREVHMNWLGEIVSIKKRRHSIGSECVNNHS